MILTLSWLKNHLSTKASINEIIEKLTNIGLEVEGIKESSGNMSEFKIVKILKTEKHPNADKLKLCDVSIGGSLLLKLSVAQIMQEKVWSQFMLLLEPQYQKQN